MLAVADCNNFFASCERSVDAALEGMPIVVLSNNDGVIVARSNEAKALGIKMGAPFFQVRELCKREGVRVFSGNFELYRRKSAEVMRIIAAFSPVMEVYSVDEAFMDVSAIHGCADLREWGERLREAVREETGLPISIGIAKTKVLCKLANHAAKKGSGVILLEDEAQIRKMLTGLPVEELWGIGRQAAKRLAQIRLKDAWSFREAPASVVRKALSVNAERIQLELKGIVCFPLDFAEEAPKSIQVSRSFGTPVKDLETLSEAVATFAESAARKLRSGGQVAEKMGVYIRTNRHAKVAQHSAYEEIKFGNPTSDTPELLAAAERILKKIFKPGFLYKKAGVALGGLSSGASVNGDFFAPAANPKKKKLMGAYDVLREKYGGNVFWAATRGKGAWKGLSEHRHGKTETRKAAKRPSEDLAEGLGGPKIKFLDEG